jgi:hypothetical protein
MITALINNRIVQTVALLAACSALIAFGVVGIGRGDSVAFSDVRYFYIAGEMLREGLNPYDFELFKAAAARWDPGGAIIGVYPYPPHSLVFCYILSAFSLAVAKWIWTGVSIAMLVAVAWVLRQWLLQRASAAGEALRNTSVWILVIAIGNPFSAHIVWIGQTGLYVLGFLTAAWVALSAKRFAVAGICLAAASMKPQLSVLVILWVMLSGHWRPLGAAAVWACVFLAPAAVVLGPTVVLDWLSNVSSYNADLQLQLSYLANLSSLLAAAGVPVLATIGQFMPLVAVGLVAWIAHLSKSARAHSHDVFATLIAASVWLVFGRDYDIAILLPLVPMFMWHCRHSRWRQFAAAAILALLCVPHRLVELAEIQALLYWRIVLVGVLLVWSVRILYSQSRRPFVDGQVSR